MSLPSGFRYLARFLEPERADALLGFLREDIAWRQYPIRVYGRQFLQPRLTAWFSDPGVSYRYSGIRLQPTPWPAPLAELRTELRTALAADFNSVLLNAYRDGSDAMGWHSDDEPELGPEPLIASVSLGQARSFRIRPRRGGRSHGVVLEHGSLLQMEGNSQADFQHSLPRSRKPMGLRVNLTFRTICDGR